MRFEARPDKGNHGRLYFGERFATVKDRRKELGAGFLTAMPGKFGLDRKDGR